jgi:coenzyme F420-reducing hydrogenase alpha subunit
VALSSDTDEYPLLSGAIASTDGVKMDKKEYRKIANEYIVPHSSAKHTRLSRESYAVGALARINLNYDKLHPSAKEAALTVGLKPKCINPFFNTVAQLVESVHCVKEAVSIIEELTASGINYDEVITVGINERANIPVRAGNGVGAVEVPRGLLFHNYTVDDKGIITDANCIIPTNQNLNNIELDMQKLVPRILDLSEEEITGRLEMLVRAYDPCISCSTHMMDVRFLK